MGTGPVLYDERGAREQLGNIGRSKLFELLASGELRSVHIGRRRLIPATAIDEYAARLAKQSSEEVTA
jgi:excisionase family DNA binding protein